MRNTIFFDDRMRYQAFIQNTNEKIKFCESIFPHIQNIKKKKSYVKILDAGTGDGTIASHVMKAFHKCHPNTLLFFTGKEVSYQDITNTLEKLPDRFMEHPKLVITLTNVKYSQIDRLSDFASIYDEDMKIMRIELFGENSYDFNTQITNHSVINFVNRYWGVKIDESGNTRPTNPCIIKIFRSDQHKFISPNIESAKPVNKFDLIIASQAYRSRSSVERKVRLVIEPLMNLLDITGELLITHSIGGEMVSEILKIVFEDFKPFPILANDLICHLQKVSNKDCNHYLFSAPSTYNFTYISPPDGVASELFGLEVEKKIESLLYYAQVTNEQIGKLKANNKRLLNLREVLRKTNELTFENEFFSIKNETRGIENPIKNIETN